MDLDTDLGPPERAPEIRHATLLMADIVDSTRLATRLDLDDQRALASAFRVTVLTAAQRCGGHVLRFEGDGAFVSFGHPVPSEDAAESAVRMGLGLTDAVRRIGVVPQVQLRLRVGIASGVVAVGDLEDRAANVEEAIEGPVPSMAERLKSHADPDTVVIDAATHRLAAHFFEYADLGVIAAKGFDAGLHAWRVIGATQVTSRFEAQREDARGGEIVGRDAEVQRLAVAWASARGGIGRAIALVGDAGLGKSRLARVAVTQSREDGATMLEISCTPSTGNSPLFPIGVLLRRLARITPDQADADRMALARQMLDRVVGHGESSGVLPYLAPLFGLSAVPLPSHQTPGEVRDQTVSAIVRMLRSLASQGPMVLLCEDLHWADASTIDVVRSIAAEIASLPALLVVTSRTLADAPIDSERFDVIDLRPLPDAAATSLIRALAPPGALNDDTVQNIVMRGEGVPLFLEEITRNALEEGAVDEPGALASVPATLQLVVQARLGRWPQLKPIVQAASVLGREFSTQSLERMLPERCPEIAATIALLAVHGLFVRRDPDGGDRVQFKHALIRDTVYQTLLRGDRQRLHSRAADTFAAGGRIASEIAPEVLAHHLVESRRFVEAIRTRLEASAANSARGAFVEATGHCDEGLRWIDRIESDAERRLLQFGLLVQRAVALTGKSGYAATEVEDAYRSAHALCDDTVTAHMRYPILRGLAGVNLVRGQLKAAHAVSIEGFELAEQSTDPCYRLDALSMRIYTTLYFGRLDECHALIDRFLTLYRETEGQQFTYPVPHDAATAVLSVLPTVAWLLGDSEAAEAAIRDGLAHVEGLGRPFDRAMMHSWIAGTRYTQRRYADAAQHAMKAVEISAPRGFREWVATGTLLALLAQVALQPSVESIGQLRQVCGAFDVAGIGLNASYYAWGLARGLVQLRDWAGAEAALDAAATRALASGESRMNAEILLLRAELPALGARAPELLAEALLIAESQGAIATALRAAALLATGGTGDDEAALAARRALARLDGLDITTPEPGWMARDHADLKRLIALRPLEHPPQRNAAI